MSDERIGEIRARHYAVELTNGESICFECDDRSGNAVTWPCDIAHLLAEVERLRGERDEYAEAVQAVSDDRKRISEDRRQIRKERDAAIRVRDHAEAERDAAVAGAESLLAERDALAARLAASERRVAALVEAGRALVDGLDDLTASSATSASHVSAVWDRIEGRSETMRAALAAAATPEPAEEFPCSLCGWAMAGPWCDGCEAPICGRHGPHSDGNHAPTDHAATPEGE